MDFAQASMSKHTTCPHQSPTFSAKKETPPALSFKGFSAKASLPTIFPIGHLKFQWNKNYGFHSSTNNQHQHAAAEHYAPLGMTTHFTANSKAKKQAHNIIRDSRVEALQPVLATAGYILPSTKLRNRKIEPHPH
jgi:hypothetical protein